MEHVTIESLEKVTGFKIAMICKDKSGEIFAFEKNAEIDRNYHIEFYRYVWRAPKPNPGQYCRLIMLNELYKEHDWEIPIYTTELKLIGTWFK